MDTANSHPLFDLSEAIDFFETLGVKFPEDPTSASLASFKTAQDAHWAEVLQRFQQLRTIWAKEQLRLDQLLAARELKPKAIAAQEEIVAAVRADFDGAFRPLMEARAGEEVARALPYAEDPAAARFVARQLKTAKIYLGLS